MKNNTFLLLVICLLSMGTSSTYGQKLAGDSTWKKQHKNVIRYNLSSALLFGFDKAIQLGYERAVGPHQSFSVNFGKAGLPKLVSFNTDSFTVAKDLKNSGKNISVDYRFYLGSENKFNAPHGVYIGPWYSFNHWGRDNNWEQTMSSGQQQLVSTKSNINLNMAGFEMGYQFIIWKRLAIDMVMFGPGIGWYSLNVKAEGNLTEEQREKLQNAVTQIIQQKFPGMNYVLSDKELKANGTLRTTSVGFRYVIHIGFAF